MMVFNVCVNVSSGRATCEKIVSLIDHVTLNSTVIIDCQCITIVQTRY